MTALAEILLVAGSVAASVLSAAFVWLRSRAFDQEYIADELEDRA